MEWICIKMFGGGIRRDFYVTRYEEKILNIDVIYKTKAQALFEASITVPNKEKRRKELEYYYRKVFVGMGEDFFREINDLVRAKRSELEKVATESDTKAISSRS